MTNFNIWLKNTVDNPEIYEELLAVRDNEAERQDRFYKELTFGTGGLRGVIGAGTNRMNVYTVGRATAGLADYMLTSGAKKSIVIAYDSRNKSREFAFRSAEIMSSMGIHAYVFDKLTPTPVLSFAVRELGAGAGIVITASHNPKEYNGYKVYNEHGCQITDLAAKEILDKINKKGYFDKYEKNDALITVIKDEILEKYLNEIEKYSLFDRVSEYAPRVVYTPLYGTGNIPVRAILDRIGVKNVSVVKEQELPNGDFTTCPYPNPEEKAALALALEEGRKTNAELILATDPDADRVGIAVRDSRGDFILLNGNETGLLLMNYMLERKSALGTLGHSPVVIKTIVTTDMAFSVAEKYGATVREVLTGFKYIGEAMDTLDNFVMGMEESYGYLVGTFARDKDAVSAVMLITEMFAYYKSLGISLYEQLEKLYCEHGHYLTDLLSKTYKGASGAERMKQIIAEIRSNPNIKIDGEELVYTDFGNGIDGLPKSDVLRFKSENVRILIRPSGTEPKIKIYYQIKASSPDAARKKLTKVKEIVEKCLS
ncbi:MAG: phospho-sugar mutase [Clostridia bacterium]|nr:phospho-sugar mutase [Clostridia bacterium]